MVAVETCRSQESISLSAVSLEFVDRLASLARAAVVGRVVVERVPVRTRARRSGRTVRPAVRVPVAEVDKPQPSVTAATVLTPP